MTLDTARLRIRELTPADAPFILALLNDPDFIRNIGDRNSAHDEFTIARLPHLEAGGAFFDVLAVPSEEVAALTDQRKLPGR